MISPVSLRSTASGLSRTSVRSDMAGRLPARRGAVTSGEQPAVLAASRPGHVDRAGSEHRVIGVEMPDREGARLLDRLAHEHLLAPESPGRSRNLDRGNTPRTR